MSNDKTARVGVITQSEATMNVGEQKTFTVTGDTIRTASAANANLSIEATTQTSTSVTVIAMTEGEDTLNIIFVNDGTASVPIHIVSESSGDGGSGGGGSTTVPVTGIDVDAWSVDLEVGQTHQMVASVVPSNATNQKIWWWVESQSIATVSDSGLIRAVSAGTTRVTATTDDGGYLYNITVTVTGSSSGGNNNGSTGGGGTGGNGSNDSDIISIPDNELRNKVPYLSTYYVEPTIKTEQNRTVKFLVTDIYGRSYTMNSDF